VLFKKLKYPVIFVLLKKYIGDPLLGNARNTHTASNIGAVFSLVCVSGNEYATIEDVLYCEAMRVISVLWSDQRL
jgi:hypothetical protein